MAYRQLCAVTFAAFGLLCAACSGGPGGAVASSNNDRAPSSGDRPPSGTSKSDAAPTTATTDQAPISSDTPPGTSDAAAGNGSLGALCQELCTSLNGFLTSCGAQAESGDLCGADSCKVPAGYPCGPEAAAAFRCLIDTIDGLTCSGVAASGSGQGNGDVPGNGNGANPPKQMDSVLDFCKAEFDKANACGQAHGLETDSSGGDTPQQHGCYPQGGCECDDPCAACTCKAGGNADKTQACFKAGAACAVTR